MSRSNQLTIWKRWIRQPQKIWLRRALFQVHLWSGIAIGLYILLISVTGSVVVYSNELYRAATPKPIISKSSGPQLTNRQLGEAAVRLYPSYRVMRIGRAQNPDEAVDVWLSRGNEINKRLFDPRSGEDLGGSVPTGIWLVSKLLDLHDNLLAGPTGRTVNGVGALGVLVLGVTGLVIWWPGIRRWRLSITLPRRVGWKRFTWHLHSVIGFWSFGFLIIFGASGVYLANPQPFENLVDRLDAPTVANAGIRVGDRILYWLAYLHFGRINGIGIPCHGPGVCDQAIKAIWALFGLAPTVMFMTGAIMWWNRVLRPKLARSRRPPRRRTYSSEKTTSVPPKFV